MELEHLFTYFKMKDEFVCFSFADRRCTKLISFGAIFSRGADGVLSRLIARQYSRTHTTAIKTQQYV